MRLCVVLDFLNLLRFLKYVHYNIIFDAIFRFALSISIEINFDANMYRQIPAISIVLIFNVFDNWMCFRMSMFTRTVNFQDLLKFLTDKSTPSLKDRQVFRMFNIIYVMSIGNLQNHIMYIVD
jgi:hypothetical protein